MRPNLALDNIQDPYIRETFRLIDKYFRDTDFFNGEFKHYEIVLSKAVTDYQFSHNLGFVPKDVLTTFISGGATLTWKYDNFTRTYVQFTTSAATTIRCFIGRFDKGVQL